MTKLPKWWNGYAVSQEDRDSMLRESFDEMAKSSETDDHTFQMTGDCLVLATRHTHEDGTVQIEVYDLTVRRHDRYRSDGSLFYEDSE